MKTNEIEKKEIKIVPPEGYKIDTKNSTFECIKFEPIEKETTTLFDGYLIEDNSVICYISNLVNQPSNYNVFATKQQAKSALAMARLSQIMENDKRFGYPFTTREWMNPNIRKFVITRIHNHIETFDVVDSYYFLAFRTWSQREKFLKEYEKLIKDYLMIDDKICYIRD